VCLASGEQVCAARGLQTDLWAELALKVPSQARLDSIGTALRETMAEADNKFSHLLRLNPRGVPVMRRYSTFLAEVGANCGIAAGRACMYFKLS
jgi:hypothetical protein